MDYIHDGIAYVRVPYEKDGVGCDDCCFNKTGGLGNLYCNRPNNDWSCVNLEPFKDLYVFKKFVPKRIQRKRTKGWRMPTNTVYCGRPSKWGNPFTVEEFGLEDSIKNFKECLENPALAYYYFDEIRSTTVCFQFTWMKNHIDELRGNDLACWCSLEKPCHTDVLIEMLGHKPQHE